MYITDQFRYQLRYIALWTVWYGECTRNVLDNVIFLLKEYELFLEVCYRFLEV